MIRTDDPTPSALAELAAEVDDLRARYAAHHLLDLAVGVLVAQLGLEPQDAARHLEELAAAAGTPATDLAADIVNQAAGQVVSLDLAAVGREARALRRVGARVQVAEELDEVATALVEDGLERFGASGLLLWRASSDGCLALVGGHGCSSLEMSRWRLLPPQLCSLPMEALTESHPLWFPKGPEERGVLPGPSAESARALIPLRARGRTVGLALVLWPGPAPSTSRHANRWRGWSASPLGCWTRAGRRTTPRTGRCWRPSSTCWPIRACRCGTATAASRVSSTSTPRRAASPLRCRARPDGHCPSSFLTRRPS
ncbi:ANTAR domain-containing protein [Streptacidiphilus monticola]